MPLPEVCLEVDAQELERATADQNATRCDLCQDRPGRSWWGVLWLCRVCRAIKDRSMERERIL